LKLDSVRLKALDLISLKCQRFYPESTNQTALQPITENSKLQTANCKLPISRGPKTLVKKRSSKKRKKGLGSKMLPKPILTQICKRTIKSPILELLFGSCLDNTA